MIIVGLLILLSGPYLPSSFATLSNITIDDQNGDPTNGLQINYNPPSAWHAGQTCAVCTAKVTPASDAWMGTWMDATFNPVGGGVNNVPGQIIQASISFTGVAVYVNVILTGSTTPTDGNSDYTFFLDNNIEGFFQKPPNGDLTYHFNQTVFSKDGLNNTLHTLNIEAGHSGQKALVLLDSVIYTTDDRSSDENISTTPAASSTATITPVETTRSASTPIGAIVGPIIAFVVIFGVILTLLYRRRKHKDIANNHNIHAEYGSGNHPTHRDHMSEVEVYPYSIPSGAMETSGNTVSLYPKTLPSHQMSSDLTSRPDSNSDSNQPNMSSSDMTNPSYIQNTHRHDIIAQMMANTGNESASGSEVLFPPAYNDIDHGPSPPAPNASSRPLPIPRCKN